MNHRTRRKGRRPGEFPRAARWLSPLFPAVVALGLLAVACGGSSGAEGEGVATAGGAGAGKNVGDTSAEKDPQQAGLDFARCMREHGVDMPDPEVGEGGMVMIGPGGGGGAPTATAERPPAGFEDAHKACAHLLADMIQDGGAEPDPEEQDRALKFARCMREHGVDIPDPDFSGGQGFSIQIGEGGMDPASQIFKEAQKACGGLFGPGGAGPGIGIAGRATS